MAKERNLPQKTSVSIDDYVRVVGTDNASYKQIISSMPAPFKEMTGTDLLATIKGLPRGTYFFRMDSASGFPVTGGVVYRIVKTHQENDARASLLAVPMDANASIYTAFITSASATSISWVAQPTRAEIDALNSNLKRKIANYNNITIPASGYVFLDSYATLGVTPSYYLFAMSIRGWSGNDVPKIVKGQNGTDFYAVGTPGTYPSFGVEYYFAVSVDVL